jgi:hypothetical protein
MQLSLPTCVHKPETAYVEHAFGKDKSTHDQRPSWLDLLRNLKVQIKGLVVNA